MDTAVALVDAYLHANGYLTAAEYPIVEAIPGGGFRAITDIDMLAVRLPGAGRIVPGADEDIATAERIWDPDPLLLDEETDNWTDFIIAEVKEGKAELNRGARDKRTIITALRRFAFVPPDVVDDLAEDLLRRGRVQIKDRGYQIRMFAFGGRRSEREPRHTNVILLHQCLDYMVRIGRQYADYRAVQIKDPTINMLAILEKAGYLHRKRQPRPEYEQSED